MFERKLCTIAVEWDLLPCPTELKKNHTKKVTLEVEFAISESITIFSDHHSYNYAMASFPVSHCVERCPEEI